ncbi:hypothetical protein [Streptomyces canus]|uniref:hypothetical protein n=1 Tax=Streptomyces canus TaxID=58343 RepID=UPI0030E353F5
MADKVQTTLRETAAAAGIGKDVRVDVDLICSPRRFMRGIKELEQVKRITVTFKLPNSGCTYSDEIGKMLGVGSVKLTQTQENDEGLITSNKALRNIAPGIENGDTELTAESVKGDVWSSQDHPEEYNAETKDADPSLLPLLLLLALAWLHDNWPWRGWAGDS